MKVSQVEREIELTREIAVEAVELGQAVHCITST